MKKISYNGDITAEHKFDTEPDGKKKLTITVLGGHDCPDVVLADVIGVISKKIIQALGFERPVGPDIIFKNELPNRDDMN